MFPDVTGVELGERRRDFSAEREYHEDVRFFIMIVMACAFLIIPLLAYLQRLQEEQNDEENHSRLRVFRDIYENPDDTFGCSQSTLQTYINYYKSGRFERQPSGQFHTSSTLAIGWFDERGGQLICKGKSGISLNIPEGALSKRTLIHMAVRFGQGGKLKTPIIVCGRDGIQFREVVHLTMPHCLHLKLPGMFRRHSNFPLVGICRPRNDYQAEWTTRGCKVELITATHVVLAIKHFTSFGAAEAYPTDTRIEIGAFTNGRKIRAYFCQSLPPISQQISQDVECAGFWETGGWKDFLFTKDNGGLLLLARKVLVKVFKEQVVFRVTKDYHEIKRESDEFGFILDYRQLDLESSIEVEFEPVPVRSSQHRLAAKSTIGSNSHSRRAGVVEPMIESQSYGRQAAAAIPIVGRNARHPVSMGHNRSRGQSSLLNRETEQRSRRSSRTQIQSGEMIHQMDFIEPNPSMASGSRRNSGSVRQFNNMNNINQNEMQPDIASLDTERVSSGPSEAQHPEEVFHHMDSIEPNDSIIDPAITSDSWRDTYELGFCQPEELSTITRSRSVQQRRQG